MNKAMLAAPGQKIRRTYEEFNSMAAKCKSRKGRTCRNKKHPFSSLEYVTCNKGQCPKTR